jgi:hypothetical protein
MRPRDRSAQYDRRRLIERVADKRRPTLRSGALSIAGGAGLTGVGEISSAALDAAGWYDWNWRYRVPIIIDRSLIPATLTSYPLYLSEANMPAGLFAAAQASGNDVLVTAADGVTKLAHDLVHWYPYGTGAIEDGGRLLTRAYGGDVDYLPTAGYGDYAMGPTMELHALLPVLDPEPVDDAGRLLTQAYGGDPGYLPSRGYGDLGDSATAIVAWIYAGNPYAADQRNAAGVWGDYLQVMHLASGAEASGNGQAGASTGTTFGTVGKLCATGGASIDGNDFINLTGLVDTTQSYTFSWWVASTQVAGATTSVALCDIQTGRLLIYWSRAATGTQGLFDGAYRAEAAAANDGNWHLQHLVVDAVAGTSVLYSDGLSVGADSYTARNIGAAAYIGRNYTGSAASYFVGALDEFRIRLGTVSAQWVATERANQVSPGTFYTMGTPQIARL